ncbi:MAG: PaaI family thioesterase [Deltaproteobacteria bacterium]|nr:PaaI family thioesterase [Deltaproteobacteria bacterium]
MVKNYRQLVAAVFSHPDNFGELVGYEIVEAKENFAKTSLKIESKHISPAGMVHGGVISTFVDFSMGACLFSGLKAGERCSTIEFKINYISTVKLNEIIYCDAKVKYRGKSHAVTEAHVYRHKGKDIAMAMGTYNIYKL